VAQEPTNRLVGVDVGGTKIAVAVLEGTTLDDVGTWPTDVDNEEELLDQFTEAILGAGRADAVGLAVPSAVDFETGTARFSVNVPLAGVPLRSVLRDRLRGMPVYVDNDATCAALAEAYDDDRRRIAHHLVMLTIGTGIGGGIVIDGRIYRGASGAAAEVGHQLIGADLADGVPPPADRPPQPGTLEALAAGRGLHALAQAHGLADGEEAVTRAKEGDAAALECMRILGERIGVGVANMINILDPDMVVLGGGIAAAAGELILEPARRVAAAYVLPGVGTRTRVELARYGNRAGVRGAALLAAQELESERGDDARRQVAAEQ
jgi:glucokinase